MFPMTLVTPARNLFSNWSQNQSRVLRKKILLLLTYSDPTDHASTQVKVKFSFKGLDGDHETPQEILGWHHNVERALIGLDLCTGSNQYNMCKQFMRGSALSSFVSAAMVILVNKKATAIVHAEQARDNYPADTDPAHDGGVFAGL